MNIYPTPTKKTTLKHTLPFQPRGLWSSSKAFRCKAFRSQKVPKQLTWEEVALARRVSDGFSVSGFSGRKPGGKSSIFLKMWGNVPIKFRRANQFSMEMSSFQQETHGISLKKIPVSLRHSHPGRKKRKQRMLTTNCIRMICELSSHWKTPVIKKGNIHYTPKRSLWSTRHYHVSVDQTMSFLGGFRNITMRKWWVVSTCLKVMFKGETFIHMHPKAWVAGWLAYVSWLFFGVRKSFKQTKISGFTAWN